jgi:AraC-like DNA-binding protein
MTNWLSPNAPLSTRARALAISHPVRVVSPAELLQSVSEIQFKYCGITNAPTDHGRKWRSLAEHVVYFLISNSSIANFANCSVPRDAGSLLWIMPGVAHQTEIQSITRPIRCYFLRFSLLDRMTQQSIRLEQDYIVNHDAWAVLPYFKQLVDTLETPHGHYLARARYLTGLIAAWALDATEAESPVRVFSAQQRRRIVQFMESRIGEEVAPSDIAESLELTPRYFSRIFHQTYNMSPRHWIVHWRIQKAAMMLAETEMKPKEIAFKLGYCNRHLFSRQFKEVMGVGARAYRNGGADKM